jgi:SsrA-binding protein
MSESGKKLIASNKKARHEFQFLEFFEAGLVLQGSEVKSLRNGKVSFKDSYVNFKNGEAWLAGVHIAPYENMGPVGHGGHDPDRPRKLLLHEFEIKTLMGKVEQRGLTVVPTKMYFKNGKAKVELALSRGKAMQDRRETLRRKAVERDMEREIARRR